MSALLTRMKTMAALGPANLLRVANYRLGLKYGFAPVLKISAAPARGPFFANKAFAPAPAPATLHWDTTALLFSRHEISVGEAPPDWLANPMTGAQMPSPDRPWHKIPDFDDTVGDIKRIWELSRFDWVIALAQKVRSGQPGALERLNSWLEDWTAKNPPFAGPNWKCGQETSIRVMHLAMAARMLDAVVAPSDGLKALLVQHLERIAPTIAYAKAQDNNHGTSEAGALFIGGSWLAALDHPKGKAWMQQGRRFIEDRVSRLVAKDGGFSQYAVNYHRVMLDTLSMMEIWRREQNLPDFSSTCTKRARAASQWLYRLTDPKSGDAPVTGANDGARLLQLTDTDYRDHRPSVQLAMALFCNERAFEPGPHDEALAWLDIPLPTKAAPTPESAAGKSTGFSVIHHNGVMALMRCPRFAFRPSQADALHVDLWIDGDNVLRDAGTYSYNTDPELIDYFGGVRGHNTIAFDDLDQMPRLSRFLFGNWLRTRAFAAPKQEEGGWAMAAGYRHAKGARHTRSVRVEDMSTTVLDLISGFKTKAVLRWRLTPGAWSLNGMTLSNGRDELSIQSDATPVRAELITGLESQILLRKNRLSGSGGRGRPRHDNHLTIQASVMKVIYFHQHFSTPRGATAIRSYQMARALIAAGHEVTMVCGSYSGGETGLETEFYQGTARRCC